ncbi:MAG: tetratricopeptide repeat protein [Bacteroidota bacterium]
MKSLALMLGLVLVGISLQAQVFTDNPNSKIRSGNESYRSGDYLASETDYRAAIASDQSQAQAKGYFNLGDALFQQERWDEATEAFQKVATLADAAPLQAAAYHNLGNISMQKQDYPKAIEAYKEAIKRNPQDQQTQFNLSYAYQKLKEQQQQNQDQQNQDDQKDQKDQENQDQENKENQDQKNKDQQQQDQKQEQQDQKNQDQQQQDQKNQQQDGQEQETKQVKMTPQEIQQLLDAVKRAESQTQKKVLEKQKPKKAQNKKIEKDW